MSQLFFRWMFVCFCLFSLIFTAQAEGVTPTPTSIPPEMWSLEEKAQAPNQSVWGIPTDENISEEEALIFAQAYLLDNGLIDEQALKNSFEIYTYFFIKDPSIDGGKGIHHSGPFYQFRYNEVTYKDGGKYSLYRFIISVDANSGEMIDLIDNTGNIPFFFPLEETMVVGPMWYKPGEKNISISAEEHSVYQQLWENVSVAARGTTVYEFAMANSPRKGKLDGVLKYWPEVVVNRDYVWGVPTNDNIQQDDALFIAYAFIHNECNIDFEILSHYYPIFGYENTSPQKPIWWISFICYDNSRDDSFAIKIYANDGSIAMWSDFVTLFP